MQANKGIVMSISKQGIVVLGNDGLFYRLSTAAKHIPLIGEEIEIDHTQLLINQKKKKATPWIGIKGIRRWGLIAAILMVIMNSILIFPSSPQAAYIVALEINPSLELHMNKEDKVIKVVSINKDADQLLQNLEINGTELSTAIEKITLRAEEKGYLQNNNHPVVATVIEMDRALKQENLQAKVEEKMAQKLKKEKFIVTSTSREVLEQAHEKKLPVFKYQVVKKIEDEGIKLDDKIVASTSSDDLIKQYQIELPGTSDKSTLLKPPATKVHEGKKKDDKKKRKNKNGSDDKLNEKKNGRGREQEIKATGRDDQKTINNGKVEGNKERNQQQNKDRDQNNDRNQDRNNDRNKESGKGKTDSQNGQKEDDKKPGDGVKKKDEDDGKNVKNSGKNQNKDSRSNRQSKSERERKTNQHRNDKNVIDDQDRVKNNLMINKKNKTSRTERESESKRESEQKDTHSRN